MIFILSCLLDRSTRECRPATESKETSQADLIFTTRSVNRETGGNAWFTKLVENAKTENKDYFAVSEGVDIAP